jgi:hypothetical protein
MLLGLDPPLIDLNPRRLTPRSASTFSMAQEGATIEVACMRGLPSRSTLRRAWMRSSHTGMVRKISEEGSCRRAWHYVESAAVQPGEGGAAMAVKGGAAIDEDGVAAVEVPL